MNNYPTKNSTIAKVTLLAFINFFAPQLAKAQQNFGQFPEQVNLKNEIIKNSQRVVDRTEDYKKRIGVIPHDPIQDIDSFPPMQAEVEQAKARYNDYIQEIKNKTEQGQTVTPEEVKLLGRKLSEFGEKRKSLDQAIVLRRMDLVAWREQSQGKPIDLNTQSDTLPQKAKEVYNFDRETKRELENALKESTKIIMTHFPKYQGELPNLRDIIGEPHNPGIPKDTRKHEKPAASSI